ncbi:MAG: hypothetical protein IKZ82_07605 [Clostridia bacterium]|nr:hypothetical protein [Clostridia bacterium]
MKNIPARALAILLALLAAVSLIACKPPEKLNICDFDGFKNLRDIPAEASKLVVNFNDDLTGEFEITEEATVKEVMDILLGNTYVRRVRSSELGAGGNGTLRVITDAPNGVEYRISLHKLEKGGYYYTPETGALDAKLREIGLECGALKVR